MTLQGRLVTECIRGILKVICSIDSREMAGVPAEGPLIVMVNHINFLEVPILSTRMLPRDFRALTKQETWDHPFFRILAENWGGIPLDRENPGVESFRRSLESLKENKILLIAPEGTRTGDGILREGHPGIASLALKSGAPVLPVAHYGGEQFWTNIKRLRRTRVTIRIGEPLTIERPEALNRQAKREITDQLMYELASLMPEPYRGHYREPKPFNQSYLRKAAE